MLSGIGALVVFTALGLGGVRLWQAETDLVEHAADKHTLQDKLVVQAEANRATKAALARATAAETAALEATEDLVDRVAAAPTPAELVELQAQVEPKQLPPTTPRDAARAEWRTGHALRRQDPVAARHHFEAAIAADPSFAAPYNSLGRLAFDRHELVKATEYYQEALKRSPSYGPALYNLAIASDRQGRRDEARRYASELQRLHPENAKAGHLVERLAAPATRETLAPLP